ncbi:hypothetical protein AAHA92_10896 [Salvia divinorum]|uniref:Uncharacterized protein n=1 Tax=Salvia divinorum TaxID=28513 RepID=A0ABD1HXZ4_SALDI
MAESGVISSSPPSISAQESADASRTKWVFGGAAVGRKSNSEHEDYAMRRAREAEKAERIMHLICWGPTK